MNGKKILIVDDDAVILKTLSLKITKAGFNVATAADGSEAVSAVRHDKPSLILLDITFPPDVAHGGGLGWDGFAIIQWLRRLDEAKDIPIIVITGGDAAKHKQRALEIGAVDFFVKPVNTDELLARITNILGEAPAPSGPKAG